MPEIPLPYRSASELGRLIREKRVSSVELTRLYLERLEQQGRDLNAVAEVTRTLALEQAKRADDELAQGRSRGALHGVPYGAKDLLATVGAQTQWGSPAHEGQQLNEDATVIRKLREAGCVLLGKLAMVELAGGGGYDVVSASSAGAAKNPWNPARWAGGSSSGSGAATAAGTVGFAIGTETWGSITVPAAFCGLSGLRPTYGRVTRHGAMALCWTLDKIGPMARSAEDCGHLLQILAGFDPKDPTTAPQDFLFTPTLPAKPLRLGVLPHNYAQAPDAQKAFGAAVEMFRKANHRIKDAKFPADIPYDAAATVIVIAEGAAAFENLIQSERLDRLADGYQQAGLLAGLTLPASDYLRALRIRTVAVERLAAMWEEFDLLIAPTLLKGAIPAAKPLSETWKNMGGNGGPGNLAGLPSLTVPMGFDAEGLPLGLEIIGSPYNEQTILSLALLFQRETDWHTRHPAL